MVTLASEFGIICSNPVKLILSETVGFATYTLTPSVCGVNVYSPVSPVKYIISSSASIYLPEAFCDVALSSFIVMPVVIPLSSAPTVTTNTPVFSGHIAL